MPRSRRLRGLTVLFGLLLFFVGVPAALATIGDVDDDGDVDGTDAQQVLEAVIGIRVLTPAEQEAADVDGDGSVMVLDAQLIQQVASGVLPDFPPRLPQRSSPIALTRDGTLLGVVNPDTDSATFLDTATDAVLAEVPVGGEPSGIAFTRSGDRAYVTNARDASVSVVDTATLSVVGEIPVGVEPFGVAVSFRGDRAYVSNMASGTLSEIDTATDTVVGEAQVGFQPQALAITRESDAIYVTHLKGGEVSVVDADTLAVTSIPLAEIPFDELNATIPAGVPNRMKGIAIHPTLDEAWLPHILSNSGNFVETLFNTSIFPAVGVIDTSTNTEVTADRMTLFSGITTVVSNPEAVAFSPDGSLAYVVSAASNDLTIMDVASRQEVGLLRDVGDNPRGIAVTPDGLKAYVFNRLTPEVSVVDLTTETLSGSVAVSVDPLPANIANGRRLFFTSAPPEVSQDRFFGCEACHFDGRDDGQTWFFTNGPRQTLSMAGGTLNTGNLHHNGDRENVQAFAFTFTRLQNGTGVTDDQLNDLADFTNTRIRFFENPFLNPDLSRSAAARRGRRVFQDAGCAGCHAGPFFTDAIADISHPVLHDVGTFVEGTHSQDENDKTRDQDGVAGGTVRPAGSFESTFLLGVWATAPFLHDGRSATLLDVLSTDNPTDAHGVTSTLTPQELDDLVAYMQELDITNSRVRIRFPADGARVAQLTEVSGAVLPEVVSVDVFVDGAGPIAADVTDGSFTALVPPELVPALGAGALFDLTAIATTTDGEPGRDDVEVEANFGASADVASSTVDASPALITADGVSTSIVTVTPRDGLGDPVGTGLSIEVQATQGSLGDVVDVGDGSYQAVLTSSTAAVTSTLTANEQGGFTFTDTAQVTFAAGDVDPTTSSVGVAPTSLEADGIATATVTVVPRDAFGNDLGSGQAVGVATDLGSVSGAVDQGDGTYTATYTAAVSTGTATLTATVNAVEMASQPTVVLTVDVTPPEAADLGKVSFGTPVAGSSQVTGGAGSAEPLSQVTATNTDTAATAMATVNADGSFSLSIDVASNEEVCFDILDLAGNPSTQICTVPFVVPFQSVTGVVQTPASGGGFTPVAGTVAELVNMDMTDPCNPVFLPIGTVLSDTTAGDGSFEIVLPNGFPVDLDLDPDLIALAVITGPDADMDGRVDVVERFNLVSDLDVPVLVDEFTSELNFLICDNVCGIMPAPPASYFSPNENLAIESTLRDATSELDFFGLPFGQISFDVEDDVFFDVDGPKDALDQIAFDTYCEAADSPGQGALPTVIDGQVLVPSAGGPVALPGVLVDLATIDIDPALSATSIRTATTDGSGAYSLAIAGTPPHGVVAVGTMTYDGAGNPGAFSGSGSQFFLGTMVTNPANPQNVDLAGRVTMNLIQIPAVPIENFSPNELDQLTSLCRSKIEAEIGGAVPLANRTLQQVFDDAAALCAGDVEVNQLLMEIDDPEGDGCNLSASPAGSEADGFTRIEITIEPVDAMSQRVGPGRIVDTATDLGTITPTAIDERDGLYTAFLTAPTSAGTATVTASVDGAGCPSGLPVVFTADATPPAAPDPARILFTGQGVSTVTVLGLPGAAEPASQVTIENTTLGISVTVVAAADGSFRADIQGSLGNALLLRSTDASANTSTDTALPVSTPTSLPAVTNPGDAPGAVTLTPISEAALGAPVPAGYSFLRGFHLDIAGGGDATASLEVLIASGVPIPPGEDLLVVQEIDIAGAPALRPVAPAGQRGGVLFPEDGGHPGVISPGSYAYLAADEPQAFLHGTIAGTRGAIRDAEVTADVSPFADLSRPDGSYLLAADVGQTARVGAAVTTHEAPLETDPIFLPFSGAELTCDVDLPTRADRSFAFTGRFTSVSQITEKAAVLPSGDELYVALTNAGDIAILDTDSLTQISSAEDAQSLEDFAFTPNGFEAFIGYFSRVRDFTVSIEEPGLLITGAGFPKAVTILPNGNLALVASSLDNSSADTDPDGVFVIDTFANTLEPAPIPIDADPASITTNADGSRAYTVSETQGTLTVIDVAGRSALATVPAGSQPVDVVTDASELFVADAATSEVLVFDMALAEDGIPANELLASIPVGGAPSALALTPDGASLLVAEQADDTVSVIDVATRTVTDVFATVDLPPDVVIHPDGTRAYVLDRQTNPGVLEIVLADADTTPPHVVDAGPKNRPDDLLQDSPVEIVFSEKMDAATITGANVVVSDEFATPLAGTITSENGGVSAVFTPDPGVRYLLNSHLQVDIGTGVTDAAGNPLPAPDSRSMPTFVMQLPNLTLISVDLTTNGIEVNGSAGAVEPDSQVKVTNLLTTAEFTTTAGSDGSFGMVVQGLDADGYELVTSLFGGRAATDPVPLPVGFTIAIPDPLLVSYQPGPAGTLEAVGAPGAVDPQSSQVAIHNLTTGQTFATSTINPDGSFSLGIFADQGDSLELVSTILGAIVLDPVPLPTPALPAPVIEFLSPERFIQGDPATITVVGTDFGSVAANVLLTVDGVVRGDFVLDTLDEDPSRDAIVVDLAAGSDSGEITVTVAGQTSNAVPYFAELAPNTSPFGEEVIESNTVGDPAGVLGAADATFTELGEGGDITVRLGSTVEDGAGSDFQVFEDTSDGEDCYDVLVSGSSVGPFDSLGQFCGTAFVNLSGHSPIRFVRIVDAADGGNSAKIGSILAIRVPLSLEISIEGESGTGSGGAGFVSAMIPESDTFVCPEGTKSFSVNVSPAPTGGGGYGGGCNDTITWSVSGGGTVMPTNGASTQYKAPMMGGTTSTIKVTVNRTGNCTSTGSDTKTVKVDVIKVDSVQWVAKDSPLSANNHSSGNLGQRMFPDRDTATGANKDVVKVVAQVSPSRKDVPVQFKVFDPDDPSTSKAPVDTNDTPMVKGGDNKCSGGYSGFQSPANFNFGAIASSCTGGVMKQGKLAQNSKNTDMSGKAEVEFQVSWQPGNNFRVAAACDTKDFDMPTKLTDDNVSPDQADDATNIPNFPGAITDLLTTWRKLRVEIDSMGAPPANVNDVTGKFRDFVGTGNLASQATELKNSTTSFNDGSGNLDSPGARTIAGMPVVVDGGRFEKGKLVLATAGTTTTINPISKNGNTRATFPKQSILPLYFYAEDNDSSILTLPKETISGLVTEIEKVGSNFRYTLLVQASDETPVDWPDFLDGGKIRMGGGNLIDVVAVNAATPSITASGMDLPFTLTDDDVMPANVPDPDSGYIKDGIEPAYVEVEFVTAQNSPNGAFKLNNTPAEQGAAVTAVKGQAASRPEYWTVTVFAGHQLEAPKDNDPDNEGTYRGEALFGIPGCTGSACGVYVSEECIRDWTAASAADGGAAGLDPDNNIAGRKPRRQEIFNHEVGHLLRLTHPDGKVVAATDPNGGVMSASCCPPTNRKNHDYSQTSLDKIRRLPNPL